MSNLLLIVILFLATTLLFSTTTATSSPPPSQPPTASSTYPPTLFATILSTLGYDELSTAIAASNLSVTTPITLFAPSDASILSCSSCSLPNLVKELSLPGLYPYKYLQSLIFGTKIETLAPNRCVTVTSSDHNMFVNGMEITRPDLFNNGLVIIHGISGFVSHLSPLSCNVERMTSLSFLPQSISTNHNHHQKNPMMQLMLKDAILRLRASGYSIVSLALRVKYQELMELRSVTIFALDDVSIFSGEGMAYLSHFRYHVVPNRRLTSNEMVSMLPTTTLPTMEVGESLVVTTGGGGGVRVPMKVNFVKIGVFDLLHNTRIIVHGITSPFPHMHHHHHRHHHDDVAGRVHGSLVENSYAGNEKVHQSAAGCHMFDWRQGVCLDHEGDEEAPAGGQGLVTSGEGGHHIGV